MILDTLASESTLRSRIKKRAEQEKDASEATLQVLRQQLKINEVVDASEEPYTISVNTEETLDLDELVQRISNVKPVPIS